MVIARLETAGQVQSQSSLGRSPQAYCHAKLWTVSQQAIVAPRAPSRKLIAICEDQVYAVPANKAVAMP